MLHDQKPFRMVAGPIGPSAVVLLVVGLLLAGAVGCSTSSDAGSAGADANRGSTTTATTIEPLPPSTVAAPAGAEVTQPAQAVSGPGSSDLPHRDWQVGDGGSGADAWYVFEPAEPSPASAPLVIMLHGYYEFEGYDSMYELIRHTVLGGSVVVYPRWQTDTADPCPGPFDLEPCMDSAVAGIEGALAFLEADPDRVQPELDRTSYLGFSFGGILTANLTNRWETLGLPEPRAIFLDDLHDSGLDGLGEPALDDSLAGIPSTVLLACHVGAEGVISEDPTGGCNALMPKLEHLPVRNRAVVLTSPDDHGLPALSSEHGVCAARPGQADAYDWNFCWKLWDGLRDAADRADPAPWAAGDAEDPRDLGEWSDGTPIAPLILQHAAPIEP